MLADAVEVAPSPVFDDLDRDFVALLSHRDGDFPGLGLAALEPLVAAFDAVIEGVAQQVLERTDQLFEDRAVELNLRSANLQVRTLVELLRRLPHDPV